MQSNLEVLLFVVGVSILPAAARLWRIGRLSDRALTNLVIAWAPALVFVYALIQGLGVLSILAVTALVLAPGLALHRGIFDLVRE
jgi:hypothetical protein